MKRIVLALGISTVLFSGAFANDGLRPIVTDSRIKTLVYNENEVYRLVTHYGYQANIEFGRTEEIETISVGDQSAWQIIPSRRHLFIKALTDSAHTNMTIITTRRVYQFDLKARGNPDAKDEELVYVVRFFYPDEHLDANAPGMAAPIMAPPIAMPPPAMQAPAMAAPVARVQAQPAPMALNQKSFNFNYTLSGPDDLSPTRIFDDGKRTYFQFPQGSKQPDIAAVKGGKESPLSLSTQGEYLVVDTVAPQFALRQGSSVVKVYNEAVLANRGQ